MDDCLYDLLFEWAFRTCPMLLTDEDAFEMLHVLVHRIVMEAARQERERQFEWMTRVFPN